MLNSWAEKQTTSSKSIFLYIQQGPYYFYGNIFMMYQISAKLKSYMILTTTLWFITSIKTMLNSITKFGTVNAPPIRTLKLVICACLINKHSTIYLVEQFWYNLQSLHEGHKVIFQTHLRQMSRFTSQKVFNWGDYIGRYREWDLPNKNGLDWVVF